MDRAGNPQVAAFELLARGVQRQLYAMRWTQLRPIQAEAIRRYLQSKDDLLIMAETAGGKTEAAFLPVLSAIADEPTGSVRAIYVGPLKALINDQFSRLEELCTHLEVPVHRWHGDVTAARKEALVKQPGGVLLITPESIESLLINRTPFLARLFGGLRAVVIDELHAFLDNERGLHLSSLISRLRRYQGQSEPPWRSVGLSATIGDVAVAQGYLRPDDPAGVAVITDPAGGKELQFRLHGYDMANAEDDNGEEHAEEAEDPAELALIERIATDLVEHCRGTSNLVFANAKGDIELYADIANDLCRRSGDPESFLVHHGSLAKEVREDTEQTMKGGRAMTTLCSSTLEMGIDIGAVRMVGQIGPPWSVASLKQRAGRSGRKQGEPRRLRMYVAATGKSRGVTPFEALPLALLQAVAISELMLEHWVEPPRAPRLDLSTLTQQVISTIAETGAIDAAELHNRLCRDGPFRAVPGGLFARLLRSLGAGDVLEQGPDGNLILGLEGERIRSRRDFYAAFASRAEFSIVAQDRVLGTLPIDAVPKVGEHIVFAARRWQVADVDPAKLILHVQPARRRGRPRFTGGVGDIHPMIRERMRVLVAGTKVPAYLDATAAKALSDAQSSAAQHGLARRGFVDLDEKRTLFLTWTGSAAQRTLQALLASYGLDGADCAVGIECRTSASDLKRRLAEADLRTVTERQLAEHVQPKQYRKYDALLPVDLLDQCIAVDRLDLAEVLKVLSAALH